MFFLSNHLHRNRQSAREREMCGATATRALTATATATELERQFRFQLWPTIRYAVKYKKNNKNMTTPHVARSCSFSFCFYFYFSAHALCCCFFFFYNYFFLFWLLFFSAQLYAQLCLAFSSLRLDVRTSTDRTQRLRVLSSFVSLPTSSSHSSLNSRSLAKSYLRHTLLLFCKLRL